MVVIIDGMLPITRKQSTNLDRFLNARKGIVRQHANHISVNGDTELVSKVRNKLDRIDLRIQNLVYDEAGDGFILQYLPDRPFWDVFFISAREHRAEFFAAFPPLPNLSYISKPVFPDELETLLSEAILRQHSRAREDHKSPQTAYELAFRLNDKLLVEAVYLM